MHPVIAKALSEIPGDIYTPRSAVLDLPVDFAVGEVFFNVHIRINTPSYTRVNGSPRFMSDESRLCYEDKMHRVMAQAGMGYDNGWYFPDSGSEHEYMHCHPDDMSGVLSATRIGQLVRELGTGNYGSTIRWVDVYEPHELMTDAEVTKRVRYYESKIRETVLSRCKTTRKTKFVGFPLTSMLKGCPGFTYAGEKGIGGYVERTPAILVSMLEGILQDLTSKGWLNVMTQNGHTYYRTSNKTEQRTRGLLKNPSFPTIGNHNYAQGVLA